MSTTASAIDIVMCQLQANMMICAVFGNYAPPYVDYAYYKLPGGPPYTTFDWSKPYHNVITLNLESYATVPALSTPDKVTLTFQPSDFDKSFAYTGGHAGGVYAQATWNGSVGLACGNLAGVSFDNGHLNTVDSNMTCYNKELLDTNFLTLAKASGILGSQCTASQFDMRCLGYGVWGATGGYTVQNYYAPGWSGTDIVNMFTDNCKTGCTNYAGGSAQMCRVDPAYSISDVISNCKITLNARVQAPDDWALLKDRLTAALTSMGTLTSTYEHYDSCDETFYYYLLHDEQNMQLSYTELPLQLTIILKNALPLGDRSYLSYQITCDNEGSTSNADMCSVVASLMGVAGAIYEPVGLAAALASTFCEVAGYGLNNS